LTKPSVFETGLKMRQNKLEIESSIIG